MMESDLQVHEFSSVEKGRELLTQGDISSAIEFYGKIFDPDAFDEEEARTMLIEARSHLTRKHLLEALESFEDALLMGTDIQRRQALEGISTIGEIRTGTKSITKTLKKEFSALFGKKGSLSKGISLISDEENVVLITLGAIEILPAPLAKSSKIQSLPPHLVGQALPLVTDKCVSYTDDMDMRFILEVVRNLAGK